MPIGGDSRPGDKNKTRMQSCRPQARNISLLCVLAPCVRWRSMGHVCRQMHQSRQHAIIPAVAVLPKFNPPDFLHVDRRSAPTMRMAWTMCSGELLSLLSVSC